MAIRPPAGVVWCVVVCDDDSGSLREQIMTPDPLHPLRAYIDMLQSVFQTGTGDQAAQSHMFLTFKFDTPDLNIHEKQEVWAGYRNYLTGAWWTGAPLWGGYINKATGGQDGGEHTIACDLVDYGHLYTTQAMLRWPRNILDQANRSGYPYDYSAYDWLVGSVATGQPFDGVLWRLQGCDMTGVDTRLRSVIFDNSLHVGNTRDIGEETIPGDTSYFLNQFEACTLRVALEEIAKGISWVGGVTGGAALARPAFWVEAVPTDDGIGIRPRPRVTDLAAPGPILWRFAQDPGPGELPMEGACTHERDAGDVQTWVAVVGQGTDTALPPDPLTGEYPLTYFVAADPAHQAHYPTRYHTSDLADVPAGWGGAPYIDETIAHIALAQRKAERVENQQWGARGIIGFSTDTPVRPGDWIHVRWPLQGLDNDYPVISVTIDPNAGRPLYTVKCGHVPIDLTMLLQGTRTDAYLRRVDSAYQSGTGSSTTDTPPPGTPRGATTALTQMAMHSNQSVQRPVYRDVTAHTWQGTNRQRPDGIAPAAPLTQAKDPAGNIRDYLRADGVDGVIRVPFHFTAAGSIDWLVDDPGTIQRMLISDNTVTVTLTELDAGTLGNPDLWLKGVPPGPGLPPDPPTLITAGTPLPILESHLITVAVDGPCSLTLSGRGPLQV
jgi:hypothetical protein